MDWHITNWGFPGDSDGKESAFYEGDLGWIPGSERSPGSGNGYPLQYACLGNPIDGGAWQGSQRVRHSWVTNTLNVILAFVFVMTFCFGRGMQDHFPFCKVCVGSEVDTHEKWLWRGGSGLAALNLSAFNFRLSFNFSWNFRSLSTSPQKKFFFCFQSLLPSS